MQISPRRANFTTENKKTMDGRQAFREGHAEDAEEDGGRSECPNIRLVLDDDDLDAVRRA